MSKLLEEIKEKIKDLSDEELHELGGDCYFELGERESKKYGLPDPTCIKPLVLKQHSQAHSTYKPPNVRPMGNRVS
jgi:hypothetical protein